MHFRFGAYLLICATLIFGLAGVALAQKSDRQSELSPLQRLDVMRSRLESMRRSLNSALSSMGSSDKDSKNLDDPRVRLRSLDKEVGSLLSEVNDLRGKQERSERYDQTSLERLETAVSELNGRVETGLQATAGARTSSVASNASSGKKKKKGKFLGLFGGGGGNDKYEELTGTVAPGRDRVLFEEAAKEVRGGRHETGRLLFSTIINTYPDSAFLPLAKLAIADSFYLEGTTSALIQAAQAYLDWLTFFPTDPLADDAMLKVAEAEMRQMGLSDRDVTHARKAEQRLKALLQQYPQTNLRPIVEAHLIDTQENLAMHGYQIGNFYLDARYKTHKGGLKGAQSRFKEVLEKYPHFSLRDEVLFKFAYTFQQEEEPDEAAKFYQELLRNFPNSEYADKAREQLSIIGAPVPDPDPARRNVMPAERPGFMSNLMQQVSGKANVSARPDGILISKDKKEGRSDLIDEAIKYNGQLPTNVMPQAPVQRTPGRTVPSNNNATTTTPNVGQPAVVPAATTPAKP